jgi:SPP1 gp7 family putative phage head morphogenesis protein
MAAGGDKKDVDDAVDGADWAPIAEAVAAETATVAADGAKRALTTLGVADDESITSQTFTKAVDAAKARAAELVGRRWDGDELVDNDDASMTITDSTRGDIRDAVADAIEDGDSAAELADRIEGLGAFGEDRALAIARTEIIRAHAQGQMTAMRESGVVHMKAWSTAGEEVCDDCQGNEDQGAIDLDDDFESGDDAPPCHVNCRCSVVAAIDEGDSADEDESEEDEDEDEAAE